MSDNTPPFSGTLDLLKQFDAGQLPEANATPDLTRIKTAILATEGSSPNSVSSKGAIGSEQIMPNTFRRYAQKGESIDNPTDRSNVMDRILSDGYSWAGNLTDDPEQRAKLTAAFYFSGPTGAAMWANGEGHKRNDSAPGKPGLNVNQYVDRFMGKLGGQVDRAMGNMDEPGKQSSFVPWPEGYTPSSNMNWTGMDSSAGTGKKPVEEESLGGSLVRGAKTAFKQIPQMGYGTLAFLGDVFDSDWMKKTGLAGYERASKELEVYARPYDDLQEAISSGHLGNWGTFAVGYGFSQLAQALATGALGGALGKATLTGLFSSTAAKTTAEALASGQARKLAIESGAKAAELPAAEKMIASRLGAEAAGAAATKFGTVFGMSGNSLSMELGQIYPEAVEESKKTGKPIDLWRIGLAASGAAALDVVPDMIIAGKLMDAAKRSKAGLVKRVAGGMGEQSLLEGTTEGAQTVIERWGANQEIFGQEGIKDIINSAAMGAVGGAVGGGLAGIPKPPPERAPNSPVTNAAKAAGTGLPVTPGTNVSPPPGGPTPPPGGTAPPAAGTGTGQGGTASATPAAGGTFGDANLDAKLAAVDSILNSKGSLTHVQDASPELASQALYVRNAVIGNESMPLKTRINALNQIHDALLNLPANQPAGKPGPNFTMGERTPEEGGPNPVQTVFRPALADQSQGVTIEGEATPMVDVPPQPPKLEGFNPDGTPAIGAMSPEQRDMNAGMESGDLDGRQITSAPVKTPGQKQTIADLVRAKIAAGFTQLSADGNSLINPKTGDALQITSPAAKAATKAALKGASHERPSPAKGKNAEVPAQGAQAGGGQPGGSAGVGGDDGYAAPNEASPTPAVPAPNAGQDSRGPGGAVQPQALTGEKILDVSVTADKSGHLIVDPDGGVKTEVEANLSHGLGGVNVSTDKDGNLVLPKTVPEPTVNRVVDQINHGEPVSAPTSTELLGKKTETPAATPATPATDIGNQLVDALANREPTAPAGGATSFGEGNTVFTKDRADKARELLRKKLGQVNAGLDPEIVQAGIELAGYYIEGGARAFADYAAKMVGDLGEAAKPYLRSWYEAVRYYPGFDATGMSTPEEIAAAEKAETAPAKNTEELESAAHEAATSPHNDLPQPTDGQKEAGNYQKGHVVVQGLDISIENPRGSVRSGTSPDGTKWQNTLAHHYGYIKGTVGRDKDHLDIFLTPGAETAANVWVIDQTNPDGSFDEHKVVLGPDTEEEARAAYLANYAPGWDGIGAISSMPMAAFKAWMKTPGTKKPLAYEAPQGKKPAETFHNESAPSKQENRDAVQESGAGTVGAHAGGNEIPGRSGDGEGVGSVQPGAQTSQEGGGSAGAAAPAGEVRAWVREKVVELIGLRTHAQQHGTVNAWRKFIDLAKRYMDGEDVLPSKFKSYLISFKNDEKIRAIVQEIHDRVKEANNKSAAAARQESAKAKEESSSAGESEFKHIGDNRFGMQVWESGDGRRELRNGAGRAMDKGGVMPPRGWPLDYQTIEELGWRATLYAQKQDDGMWRIASLKNHNPISPAFDTEAEAEAWAEKGPDQQAAEAVAYGDQEAAKAEAAKQAAEAEAAKRAAEQAKKDAEKKAKTEEAMRRRAEKSVFAAALDIPEILAWGSNENNDPKTFMDAAASKLADWIAARTKDLIEQNGDLSPEDRAISGLIKDGKVMLPEAFFEGLMLEAKSRAAQAAKAKVRENSRSAMASAMATSFSDGATDEDLKAFEQGWMQAMDGKTKSTLPDGRGYAIGYDAARAWMKTPEGRAAASGKRVSKLENTGADLRRWFDKLRAEMKGDDDAVVITKLEAITSRAKLLEGALTEDATPGAHRWLDYLRNNLYTFKEWLNSWGPLGPMSGVYIPRRESKGDRPILEFLAGKRYNDQTKGMERQERIEFLLKAAEQYADMITPLTEALRGATGVRYAAEGLKLFIFGGKDVGLSWGDWMRANKSPGWTTLDKIVRRSNRVYDMAWYGDDAKDQSSTVRHFLINETKTDEVSRKAALVPPRLDRVERNGLGDPRGRRDVTPLEFKQTFNFADVGFGQWVNARQDQDHLNYAYDAFQDLARVLGLPPEAMSLGGRLHFTIGALGHGKFAAHYSAAQPHPNGGTVPVINVTNTRGDGTVAHEWGHAVDLTSLDLNGDNDDAAFRAVGGTTTYLDRAIEEIRAAMRFGFDMDFLRRRSLDFLKGTSFWKGDKRATRSDEGLIANARQGIDYYNAVSRMPSRYYKNALALDNGKEKDPYWSNKKELFARAFEAWVGDEIQDLNGSSTYLVNPEWSGENMVTEKTHRGTPYPEGDERERFAEYFTALKKSLVYDAENKVLRLDWDKWQANKPKLLDEWKQGIEDLKAELPAMLAQVKREKDAAKREGEERLALANSIVKGDLVEADTVLRKPGILEVLEVTIDSHNDHYLMVKDADGQSGKWSAIYFKPVKRRSEIEAEAAALQDKPAEPAPEPVGELSEDELSALFDEAAAGLAESTAEQPEAPEPGASVVAKPEWSPQDLDYLMKKLDDGSMVLWSGEKWAIDRGLPTIHTVTNMAAGTTVDHIGFGVLKLHGNGVEAHFDGGGGMSHTPDGHAYTVLSVSQGKVDYPFEMVKATLKKEMNVEAEVEPRESAKANDEEYVNFSVEWDTMGYGPRQDLTQASPYSNMRSVVHRISGSNWSQLSYGEKQEMFKAFKATKAMSSGSAPTNDPAPLKVFSFRHTKTGATIFSVPLPDRVSGEMYRSIESIAKTLGGKWSSFKAKGTIPGFHFHSSDAADEFAQRAARRLEPTRDRLMRQLGAKSLGPDRMGFSELFEDRDGRRYTISNLGTPIYELPREPWVSKAEEAAGVVRRLDANGLPITDQENQDSIRALLSGRGGKIQSAAERANQSHVEASAASAIAEFAKYGVTGIDEALKGLAKLFCGGPNKLQSFPAGFNKEGYEAAKPHFVKALEAAQKAGMALKQFFQILIQQFGLGVKPYAVQFAKDMKLTADLGQQTSAVRQVANLVRDHLKRGDDLRWQDLFAAADKAWGGTQAQGKYSPKDAYDAMEMGVNLYLMDGNWTAGAATAAEAQRDIRNLTRMVESLPTQTKRDAEMDEFQQFSTPPALAYAASWAANISALDVMMEPSAGTGDLAIYARNKGASLILNELSSRRAAILKELFPGARLFTENAEQLNNVLPDDAAPTVVVMNPPFSATAGRVQGSRNTMNGALHIEQALKRLIPGGRLVAIVGEGMAMDRPAFKDWWKKISAAYNVRANIGIDGKEYAKYGTTFDNQILVIDKNGPTVGMPVAGKVASVAELPGLLEGIRNDRPAPDRQQSPDQPGSQSLPGQDGLGVQPGQPGRGDTDEVGAGERPADQGDGRADRVPGPDDAAPRSGKGQRDGGGRSQRSGNSDRGGRDGAGELPGEPGKPDGDSGQVSTGVSVGENAPAQTSVALTDAIFDPYRPQKLTIPGAKDHPGKLVQSAAMAAVDPPNPTYTPNLPAAVVKDGLLSLPQLESVVYAGQAHEQILPGKEGFRRGFFIGDGTGVGKGREIAGIILDNLRQGRKKAVWISFSEGLMRDAKRDFDGVGGDPKMVFWQGKTKTKNPITAKEGILFTAYSTLRSDPQDNQQKRTEKQKGKDFETTARTRQIVEWLGPDFDGVVVFDESHSMGNAVSMPGVRGTKKPSKQALAGLDLQGLLPKARIVYVSATGATEVTNFGYALRLGLWGGGTAFGDIKAFMSEVMSGGVGAMELVARDMKALGMYIARSLSFEGVTYERLDHELTPLQIDIYNELAKAWQVVLQNLGAALATTNQGHDGDAKTSAMSKFWGTHQRFFNQIITSMQTPTVIEDMQRHIAAGNAVVIQLVNTNESQQNRQVAKAVADDVPLEELDFTPRQGLMDYVRNGFPIIAYEEYVDDNGNKRYRQVMKDGKPVIDKDAVAIRDNLLKNLEDIRVPENPIDAIINAFGAEKVGEVTGRGRRFVQARDDNGNIKVVEEKRGKNASDLDADAFQNDEKPILIFSQAGGTGYSFQSDLTKRNQRRRIHYILQPGWRADVALQGLGRTHRSNEANQPHYVLPTTNLKAQKRFVSSIARRLDQLGALTRGQREAVGQSMFTAADNLENKYADQAIENFFTDLFRGATPFEMDELAEEMGLNNLRNKDTGGLNQSEIPTVQRFLNRLLSLSVDRQSEVFDEFYKRLEESVNYAIQNGTYDSGMQTLRAQSVVKVRDDVVYTDKRTNATTRYVEIDVTNPVRYYSWERALWWAESHGHKFLGWFKNSKGGIFGLVDLGVRVNAAGIEVRRGSEIHIREGRITYTDEVGDILNGYKMVIGSNYTYEKKTIATRISKNANSQEAKEIFEAQVAAAPKLETKRERMIVGVILPIWDRLKGDPKIVRTQTDDGERLLGRVLTPKAAEDAMKAFGIGSTVSKMSAAEIAAAIRGGQIAVLSNGWSLAQVTVSNEKRIEIRGNVYGGDRKVLLDYGVFMERIGWQERLFIPTGENATEVLAKVIEWKPVSELLGGDKPMESRGGLAYNDTDGILDDTANHRTLDGAELAALRREAAGLERPEAGTFLTVTEDGRAVATGEPRTRIPDSFARFAEKHGLKLEARRKVSGGRHTYAGFSERMPIDYRASGAMYFGEMGESFVDRTGKSMFARGSVTTDETPDSIRAALARVFGARSIRNLEDSRLLNIVATPDELPAGIEVSPTAKAAFFNDQAYLIANRMVGATAHRELLHEIGEHYGLERMLGIDGYDALMARVKELHESGDRHVTAAWDFVRSMYRDEEEGSKRFMHEVLAQLGQNADVRPQAWWQQILQTVKRFLVKMGFTGMIRVPDIQDMVLHALKVAADRPGPGPRGGVLEPAMAKMGRDAAGWTEDRVDRLLRRYAYTMDGSKTKAFAAWISPSDFLHLTADYAGYERIAGESTPLDLEELRGQTQEMFLEVDSLDVANLRVLGHEGRHRAMALLRAGVTEMPIAIYLRGGAVSGADAVRSLVLSPQRFGPDSRGMGSGFVRRVTPISYDYREELLREFASGGAVQFSNRPPLRPVETSSPAFKRWFGDSKVVDAEGRPLVVYHGTKKGFSVFQNVGGIVSSIFGSETVDRRGFFFSDDPAVASEFASQGQNTAGGNVVPAYLAIQNPIDLRGGYVPSSLLKQFEAEGVNPRWLSRFDWSAFDGEDGRHFVEAAQRLGYDGVFFREDLDDGRDSFPVFVAFRPEQIKSAISNTGEFSESPNILESQQAPIFYSQLARVVQGAKIGTVPSGQWKAWLLSNGPKLGVKKDEIQWSGITDWLDAQKGNVSKEDIAAFLDQGGVRVEEVMFTNDQDTPTFRVGGYGGGEMVGGTKFSAYQLPGGENYRELLLALPQKEAPAPKTDLEARKQVFDAYADRLSDLHERVSDPQIDQAARDDALVEMQLLQEERDRRAAGAGGEVYDPILEDPKFISGHFPTTPNILAHIRFNDRTDAQGRRVLFLEEIQSDWAQKGRKDGFSVSEKRRKEIDAIMADVDAAGGIHKIDKGGELYKAAREAADELVSGTTPPAPFVTDTKAWTALALKRMVRYAAENGYDAIAWTTGEQQAARYDLSKHAKEITLDRLDRSADKKFAIAAQLLDGGWMRFYVNTEKEAADFIGKEPAGKLFSGIGDGDQSSISGDGLKVGGEGMKGYYDSIVPQVAGDLLKKLGGGKVETFSIENPEEAQAFRALNDGQDQEAGDRSSAFLVQPGFLITRAMRDTALAGLPMFSRGADRRSAFALHAIGNAMVNPEVQVVIGDEVKTSSLPNIRSLDFYDGEGNWVGYGAMSVLNGRPSMLADIHMATERAGMGEKIVRALVATAGQNGLYLYDLLPKSIGFWQKMGVIPDNLGGWEHENGTLFWEDYQSARAAQVDAGRLGDNPRNGEGAQQEGASEDLDVSGKTGGALESRGNYLDDLPPGGPPQDEWLSRVRDKATGFLKGSDRFGWLDKSLHTQLHKAQKNPYFGKVFTRLQHFMADASRAALRPAEFAPTILPRIDVVKSVAPALKALLHGKAASADIDAAFQAVLTGTLDNTVYASPEEANLSEAQFRIYREFRDSIDASLDELAASEAWNVVREFFPHATMKETLDNPTEAENILAGGLDGMIEDTTLQAEKAFDDALAAVPFIDNTLAPPQAIRKAIQVRGAMGKPLANGTQMAILEKAAKLYATLDKLADARGKLTALFARRDKLQREGYAPLMRFGQHYLHIYRIDPTTGEAEKDEHGDTVSEFFGLFESESERDAAEKAFREEFSDNEFVAFDKGTKSEEEWKLYKGVSPETMAIFAEGLGIGKDAVFQEWYRRATSNRSALKRLIHRKGTPGFSTDGSRVLASFLTSNGRRAARLYHVKEVLDAIQAFPRNQGIEKDEAIRLMEYTENPNEEMAAPRALLFAHFLGGTISNFLINATQPAMVTLPYLRQYVPMGEAMEALKRGYKLSGHPELMDADLKGALDQAEQEGTVGAQEIFHLWQETARPLISRLGKLGAGVTYRAHAFMSIWGMPFAMAEHMNRRSTFIATFLIAKQMGMGTPAATAMATRAVNETQFVYGRQNRPNWARGSIGSLIFTFKLFSISYVELMTRLLRGNKESRKAALYMIGLLFLAAGAQGLPGSDDLDDLIDTVCQILGYNVSSKAAKRKWLENLAGKEVAGVMLNGISSLTPLDVQARFSLGNLIPGTGIFKPSSEDHAADALEIIGPVGGLAKSYLTTVDAVSTGNWERAMTEWLPKAARDFAQGIQMLSSGEARDPRGRKISETDALDALVRIVGFSPQDIASEGRVMRDVQQRVAFAKRQESLVAEKWAQGIRDGNSLAGANARQAIAEWNAKNPETPISVKISQVQRRVAEMRATKHDRLIKSATKDMRGMVKEELE